MKEEDVPQDESYLTNSLIREMCYAVDKDGNYTTVVSEGWDVEMWKWRVKRHFKPAVFKKLHKDTLSKYAKVFEISVEELITFKGEE